MLHFIFPISLTLNYEAISSVLRHSISDFFRFVIHLFSPRISFRFNCSTSSSPQIIIIIVTLLYVQSRLIYFLVILSRSHFITDLQFHLGFSLVSWDGSGLVLVQIRSVTKAKVSNSVSLTNHATEQSLHRNFLGLIRK
jgi:hypothetical protein